MVCYGIFWSGQFTETTDKAKKQVGTFDVMALFTLAINRDMLHRTWGHE